MLLGLDGAGKTAIARCAHTAASGPRGSRGASTATVAALPAPSADGVVADVGGAGFTVETFRVHGLTLQLWDVPGGEALRPYWRHYYTGTQGLIFVVSASDGERLALAAAELRAAAADEQLSGVAVAIVVTHCDIPGSLALAAVSEALQPEVSLAGHPWAVLTVNAATGAGLDAVWTFLCEKTRRL